jgi:hypothetical protein
VPRPSRRESQGLWVGAIRGSSHGLRHASLRVRQRLGGGRSIVISRLLLTSATGLPDPVPSKSQPSWTVGASWSPAAAPPCSARTRLYRARPGHLLTTLRALLWAEWIGDGAVGLTLSQWPADSGINSPPARTTTPNDSQESAMAFRVPRCKASVRPCPLTTVGMQ